MDKDDIREVIIPACEQHEGIYTVAVKVHWICPVCGRPRGKDIYKTASYDGSRRLIVNGWTNKCGHVDRYYQVRKEALENGLNQKESDNG